MIRLGLMSKIIEKWPHVLLILFIVLFGYGIIAKPTQKIKGKLIDVVSGYDFVNDKIVDVPINVYVSKKKNAIVLSGITGTIGDYTILQETIFSEKDLDCRVKTLKDALLYANNIKKIVPDYFVKVPPPGNCSIYDRFHNVQVFTREPEKRNLVELSLEWKSHGENQSYITFNLEKINKLIVALEKSKTAAINLKKNSFWDQTDIDEKIEAQFQSVLDKNK
jgi:hypothetical protein